MAGNSTMDEEHNFTMAGWITVFFWGSIKWSKRQVKKTIINLVAQQKNTCFPMDKISFFWATIFLRDCQRWQFNLLRIVTKEEEAEAIKDLPAMDLLALLQLLFGWHVLDGQHAAGSIHQTAVHIGENPDSLWNHWNHGDQTITPSSGNMQIPPHAMFAAQRPPSFRKEALILRTLS